MEYMGTHNTFTCTRILTISIWLLLVVPSFETRALSDRSGGQSQTESLAADKITADISEEHFWGFGSINSMELKLTLFIADGQPNTGDFDVLAVLPEINETLRLRSCQTEPAIIVGDTANSDLGKVEAINYLSDEMKRYSSFIIDAKKSERIVHVVSDTKNLFTSDAVFRARRVEQIKSALGALVHQRPLALRIGDFSKFTDQIEVLVPSRGESYTMSVVHRSCSEESVEVGRETSLKSVRPDLRKKIETHSISVTIN
jgi:hypothetical protein